MTSSSSSIIYLSLIVVTALVFLFPSHAASLPNKFEALKNVPKPDSKGFIATVDRRPSSRVLKTPPAHYLNASSIPVSFDWRNVSVGFTHDGKPIYKAFTTPIRNQHIPTYCGSCWAHATVNTLSIRLKIALDGAWNSPMLSPQYLINCGPGTCNGGDVNTSFEWIHTHGIVDETCQVYNARSNACEAENICVNCFIAHSKDINGNVLENEFCYPVLDPPKYYIEEWGECTGSQLSIQSEILTRGPVAVCLNDTGFENLTPAAKGLRVLRDPYAGKNTGANHCVTLTGWGVAKELNSDTGLVEDVPYWSTMNSWGTYMGDNGYLYLYRGGNHFGLEDACYWATIDPARKGNIDTAFPTLF